MMSGKPSKTKKYGPHQSMLERDVGQEKQNKRGKRSSIAEISVSCVFFWRKTRFFSTKTFWGGGGGRKLRKRFCFWRT